MGITEAKIQYFCHNNRIMGLQSVNSVNWFAAGTRTVLWTIQGSSHNVETHISRALCGIISKIKVLHLKIKVYMKNVAVFTH